MITTCANINQQVYAIASQGYITGCYTCTQHNLVLLAKALAVVADHILAIAQIEEVGICTCSTCEGVVACTTFKGVAAIAATAGGAVQFQRIVTCTAHQCVVTVVIACQGIIAFTTIQYTVART